MKFNVFEGARRIALVLAAIAAVSTIAIVAMQDPYISLSYTVAHPNAPFVRNDEQCPTDGARHYFSTKTAKGQSVSVNLCLPPVAFGDSAEQLIPYKIDEKGMVWGARTYSSEVSAYEQRLEQRFRLSDPEDQQVSKRISREYRESLLSGVGYVVLGLALFAGLVSTIGWIVRGFLGIPRGQDARPSEAVAEQRDA